MNTHDDNDNEHRFYVFEDEGAIVVKCSCGLHVWVHPNRTKHWLAVGDDPAYVHQFIFKEKTYTLVPELGDTWVAGVQLYYAVPKKAKEAVFKRGENNVWWHIGGGELDQEPDPDHTNPDPDGPFAYLAKKRVVVLPYKIKGEWYVE